jgi:hypothetical protein
MAFGVVEQRHRFHFADGQGIELAAKVGAVIDDRVRTQRAHPALALFT